MTRFLIALTATLALTACGAGIGQSPAQIQLEPATPLAPIAGVSGLEAHEPDACHAATYASAVGQPASIIPSLGVNREYRIAEYRGIEPQDYNSLRVVFRLDQTGNIAKVDCG